MASPTILAALDTFQQAANRGTAVYLSLKLVQELRDALDTVSDADALAARLLLEQVAAMADCIGANTVGQITAISNRAAAWLRQNPPGQPVATEPRGCPTPGACSCVEPIPPATEPGEMPSDELMGQWRNAAFAEYRSGGEPTWRTSALLAIAWARQQQATELASLRGEPVAVSERMPGEEDLHPEGKWCWGWKYGRYWAMMQVDCFGGEPDPDKGTHWLPHTAIPLPAPQAGEGEA